jgi:hypothetical protein
MLAKALGDLIVERTQPPPPAVPAVVKLSVDSVSSSGPEIAAAIASLAVAIQDQNKFLQASVAKAESILAEVLKAVSKPINIPEPVVTIMPAVEKSKRKIVITQGENGSTVVEEV